MTKKKAKKVAEPVRLQRKEFLVSVDVEKPWHQLRYLVEQAVLAELGKEEHGFGEVHVHAHQFDEVEEACLHFARAIREAASEAVSERIR